MLQALVGTALGKLPFVTMKNHVHPCVVIVVEDEALIRMAAVFALEDAEFAVLEAGSADEAVQILEREAADVHAVFTDVNMPGEMDGVGLAHHVRRQWPHIGLIAASGRQKFGADQLPTGSRFVVKPYDLVEVVGHVRDLVPEDCQRHAGSPHTAGSR